MNRAQYKGRQLPPGSKWFCSRRCAAMNASNTAKRVTRNGDMVTCPNCGKQNYRNKWEQEQNHKYCNLECRIEHTSTTKGITRETLEELYHGEGLTWKQVAERLSMPIGTISWLVGKYGIESRKAVGRYRVLMPPKDRLESLYLDQGMSVYQIADIFGTNKTLILRWMRRYGIERRGPRKYLDYPTKEELEYMLLGEHLSYADIAERYGCHPGLPHYWARSYGIRLNNEFSGVWSQHLGRKGFEEPTKEELTDLYLGEQMSMTAIGEILGCGPDLVRNRLAHYGIPVRHPGYDGTPQPICKAGIKVASGLELAVANWLTDHGLSFEHEPTISTRPTRRADFLVNGYHIEVWGMMSQEWYRKRRLEKLELYRAKGLTLIEVFPEDVPNNLNKILNALLVGTAHSHQIPLPLS